MKKAFTLIELLVVIAIIAILAAILFPVFAQAKQSAKKAANLSQIKQLGTAAAIYGSDYDDTFQYVPWRNMAPFTSNPIIHWSDALQPYIKNKGIMADPSNNNQLYQDGGYRFPGQPNGTEPVTSRYRVTYTYNHLIARTDVGPGATSQTAIDDIANIVLFGPSDNWYSWSNCQSSGGNNRSLFWTYSVPWMGYGMWPRAANARAQAETGGYAGGANFAFADSSARYSKMVPGVSLGSSDTNTYWGYFVRAATRTNVRTDGTCPTDAQIPSFTY